MAKAAKKKTPAKKPKKTTASGVPAIKQMMNGGDTGTEEPNYKKIPPLAAYIDRIGAEEQNFKRFIVKDYFGSYWQERVLIKIENGEVWCSRKDYAPTKDEAEAIKVALREHEGYFPKSIMVRDTTQLRKLLEKKYPGKEIRLWEFFDRKSKQIIMVQQRLEMDGGQKIYPPWTFWSDGRWRSMEPEQDLPFWKPKKELKDVGSIMVHEGAKAADFCDALVNDPERAKELAKEYKHKHDNLNDHPFGDVLRQYEHWGMIGGALAPHRTNYAELRAQNSNDTIYVCDNDFPGMDVIHSFSPFYGRSLKVIRFDKRFPQKFDLADPMPSKLFKGGRWIGPKFKELLSPATFATDRVEAEKGKATYKLTKPFRQEWFHSVKPEVFIHKDWPDDPLTVTEFNNRVKPFSNVANTALLVQSDSISKTAILRYNPAMPSGVYGADGGSYINTHRPSILEAEKGDPEPFIDYLNNLLPVEEDRIEVMRWVATLIARPENKILYGLLMISEQQGIGKSTLGEKILAPILGFNNISYPQENEIVESQYNYWLAHKRLAVVHEIYAGHSAKAYNRLKTVITDTTVSVSKKYQANYEIENWIHVYACSNSLRAIHLPNDDRRWFVPKVSEVKKPIRYWKEFNEWLIEKGGLSIIIYWAHQWIDKHGAVERGAPAPDSKTKREIVEEGLSPGQQIVSQVLDQIKEHLEGDSEDNEKKREDWRSKGMLHGNGAFVLDTALVAIIRNELYEGRHNDRLERPGTLRKLAKGKGWFIGEHRAQVKDWTVDERIALGARVIATTKELADAMPSTLCNEKMRPEDKIKPIDIRTVRHM